MRKLILFLTLSLILVSCGKSIQKNIETKNISLTINDDVSFFETRKLHFNNSDTLLKTQNFDLKELTSVLEIYYNNESDQKLSYKNISSKNFNIVLIQKNDSLSVKECINELNKVLKEEKLLDY